MDIIKFNYTESPTVLENAEIINDIESKLWVERYSDLGEFSLEGKLSSGIKDKLPIGSLISHTNTLEVMIVENHIITEKKEEDPTIIVSGRSFPSYLEERIVGTTLSRDSYIIEPYVLIPAFSWEQIMVLINDHIVDTVFLDTIDGVIATESVGGAGESVSRTINRGPVWDRVKELLAIDDLGVRTIRGNTFSEFSMLETQINIYVGQDKSDRVIFSWISQDLDSTEYLFSQKSSKTSALVAGQYVYVVVDSDWAHYDRRFMHVDATDIDGHLTEAPSGGDLTTIVNAMSARGRAAIKGQSNITITQADVSNTTMYQYRRDYNIGDLVSIDGNFGQTAVMRVIEYAEIEDENGNSGHPTLALPLDTLAID